MDAALTAHPPAWRLPPGTRQTRVVELDREQRFAYCSSTSDER
jgi:hypothetical protein